MSRVRGLDGNPVTDIGSQNKGHGTAVAAAVAGNRLGVAKSAMIIGVKISADAGVSPENQIEGFRWAIQDIQSKGRDGSAVFVSTLCKYLVLSLQTFAHLTATTRNSFPIIIYIENQ